MNSKKAVAAPSNFPLAMDPRRRLGERPVLAWIIGILLVLLGYLPDAQAQSVTALPGATVGVYYNAPFTINCGGCYEIDFSYENWDNGLNVNSGTGLYEFVVSGTPTTAGTSRLTTTYYDSNSNLLGSAIWTITTAAVVPTSIALTSSSSNPAYGSSVTLTATLGGTYANSGTVTFKDGTTSLGTVSVSSYAASLSISNLAPGSHSLTAVFNGDGTSSSAVSVNVAAATPTISLTSSTSSTSYGSNVSFTATPSNGYSPTGTVTFLDGANILGSTTLSGGSASFSTTSLAIGVHTITAVYYGDSNNASARSAAANISIVAASPTLAVSLSDSTIAYGSSSVVRAILSGAVSPSGSVTFKDGSTVLATAILTGNSATYSLSGLAVGSHSISAVFGGDSYNNSASSAAATLIVDKLTPSVTLNPSASSASYGSTITLTANVTGTMPSGSVTFKDGGTTLGVVNVAAGVATLTTSTLSVGTHSLSAEYSGDSINNVATSSVATVTITQVTPALVLSTSATAVTYGGGVTLSATVTGGASASGTVDFLDGSSSLGTVSVSGGSAALTISTLATGTHTISARYSGDTYNAAATSSALTITVGKVTAAVALSASPTSASLGSTITFNASVSGSAPSGSVVFSDGGTTLATIAVSAGAASFSTSALSIGSHSISARYSGDGNNSSATSSVVAVSIGKSTPTLSLTSSASTLNEQAPLTLTATLTGGVSPTGSISFRDGSSTLATVPLSGLSASLTLSTLAAGSHSLSALYSGDSSNNSLSSASVSVAVASIRPAVGSVAPATGSALGSTRVTISGTRLAGASSVSFGGTAARIVSNSDSELVVITGAHAPGPVDIVLVAAHGSTTLTAGFTYAALPDPAQSAAVTAMVRAQTQAVQRFASAHLSNFTQRLESLHGDSPLQSSFGLSFGQTNAPRREPTTWARGGDIVSYQDSELAYLRAGLRKTALGATSHQNSASEPDDHLPDLPLATDAGARRDITWWISGALDLASQKGSASQSGARLSTSGVSFGGDYRFSRTVTAGLGAGYSRSAYRADDDSASSNGQGIMAVAYASVRPLDDLYIDVLTGYGALDFDLARLIPDTGVLATGSRKGQLVFGSTIVGYEWRGKDWLVSPYVRLDLARATLDGYTESGGPGALTYFSQSVRNDAAYLGLRGQFDVAVPVGLLTPQARVAYQRNLQGAGEATMRYADPSLASPVYSYSDAAQESKQWLLTLGGRLLLRNGLSMTLLYTHNAANAVTTSQSLNFSVSGRF